MGGTNFNQQDYQDRQAYRAASGQSAFAYHNQTSQQARGQKAAHPSLDPKATSRTTGLKMRESRDSEVHPESTAIIICCDVTGTMGEVPRTIQKKLPQLMGLLLDKGYMDHPHIMLSAIGDYFNSSERGRGDEVPLQVGQFEAGIEIEDNITNLYLEGGGGGQGVESYDLMVYFATKHTDIDCYNKRGKKGYFFFIGDECMREKISKEAVEDIIGDKLEADLNSTELLAELQERYEVFFILPNMTSNFNNQSVRNHWQQRLPERMILLDDPNAICELIAAQVGVLEERVSVHDIHRDLTAAGTNADAVTRALVPAGSRGAMANVPDSGASTGISTL